MLNNRYLSITILLGVICSIAAIVVVIFQNVKYPKLEYVNYRTNINLDTISASHPFISSQDISETVIQCLDEELLYSRSRFYHFPIQVTYIYIPQEILNSDIVNRISYLSMHANFYYQIINKDTCKQILDTNCIQKPDMLILNSITESQTPPSITLVIHECFSGLYFTRKTMTFSKSIGEQTYSLNPTVEFKFIQ